MRFMREIPTAEPALPPAPGAEQYLALDFVNSAVALPGGQFSDLLGTPTATNQWLAERCLSPAPTRSASPPAPPPPAPATCCATAAATGAPPAAATAPVPPAPTPVAPEPGRTDRPLPASSNCWCPESEVRWQRRPIQRAAGK